MCWASRPVLNLPMLPCAGAVLVVRDDMSCFFRILPSLAPKPELALESAGEEEPAYADWSNLRLNAVLQVRATCSLPARWPTLPRTPPAVPNALLLCEAALATQTGSN